MTTHPLIRQQATIELRKLASRYVERAMHRVVKALDRDNDEVALRAANMIFERAAGKPTQELADADAGEERYAEALQTAMEQTRRLMGGGALPAPTEVPLRPVEGNKKAEGEVITLRPRRIYLPD